MVNLGIECATGVGSLPYPGKTFGYISAFDGTGYTNVILFAFVADYTFYYIIRQTDREDQ